MKKKEAMPSSFQMPYFHSSRPEMRNGPVNMSEERKLHCL